MDRQEYREKLAARLARYVAGTDERVRAALPTP
jgi:hypothetical protein